MNGIARYRRGQLRLEEMVGGRTMPFQKIRTMPLDEHQGRIKTNRVLPLIVKRPRVRDRNLLL